MKSYILLPSLLFSFSRVFASDSAVLKLVDDDQGEPKINQVDDQGIKQGKWIFLGKD